MVALPAAIPFTTPVALTVAIAVLEETQGFAVAGVALPVRVVDKPTQTFKVPVIMGVGLTRTIKVNELPEQSPIFGVMVYIAV